MIYMIFDIYELNYIIKKLYTRINKSIFDYKCLKISKNID